MVSPFERQGLDQTGGDGSSNYQAARDIVVKGFTAQQVGDIVRDAIRANAYEMRAVARQTFDERIEAFSAKFVNRLASGTPEMLAATSDPDVQYLVVQAGIGYARTGDEGLADLLVDLLEDRAKAQTRSLLAVVIADAVAVASRLTDGGIAALTVFWRLALTINIKVDDLTSLALWVKNEIAPLAPVLPRGEASYLHLQSLGCASVQTSERRFATVWSDAYPGLFTEGFDLNDVSAELRAEIDRLGSAEVLIPAIRNPNRVQVNALNELVLQHRFRSMISDAHWFQLRTLLRCTMSNTQIFAELEGIDGRMRTIQEVWDGTPLKSLRLSAVGTAIAHANWRRMTGATAPLSVWISET